MDSKDYIFKKTKNGLEYVGDFEGLYKHEKEPWGQISDPYYNRRNHVIIEALRKLNPSSVLDVGCGLGQVTQLINIMITKNVLGIDISQEAINKAEKLFPTVDFQRLNIITEELDNRYDAIVMSGVLWYLLNDLDLVMQTLNNALEYQGHLVLFQTFIPNQQYGLDKIDGFHGWFKYLKNLKDFRVIDAHYYDDIDSRKDSLVVLKKWGEND